MANALDTVADYVSYARVLLQDQSNTPYRYPDADLLLGLNLGIMKAKKLRPDLFLSGTVPNYTAVDTTSVPWDVMYRLALVYHMCGQAQLRDDEAVQDQRAAAFLALYTAELGTVS